MASSLLDQEQVYEVTLPRTEPDGSSSSSNGKHPTDPLEKASEGSHHHRYVLRGLRDDELYKWADFCASVFSYKPNPPPADYFSRHYANDPDRRSSKMIRVAIAPDGTIVASVRIFWREISTGTNKGHPTLVCGGIGEVCTDPNHRRRGLSKALLAGALGILEDSAVARVSSLHAGPAFFALYESMGYIRPPLETLAVEAVCRKGASRWTTVDLSWRQQQDQLLPTGANIRPASFPSDTDRLSELHRAYSEARLAGCIVRSPAYWNEYLSKELEGSLFVMTTKEASCTSDETDNVTRDDDVIVAWMSLKKDTKTGASGHPLYSVAEFGCHPPSLANHPSLSLPSAVGALVAHAAGSATTATTTCPRAVTLRLPGFVADELEAAQRSSQQQQQQQHHHQQLPAVEPSVCWDWTTQATEWDGGWMYRGLTNSEKDVQTNDTDPSEAFLRRIAGATTAEAEAEHFVWPSDSF